MNPREDGPKREVTATLVKLLVHRRTDRGMRLEPYASRCVRAGEVHELVATDHVETEAGARIDRVGFLGFVEIATAGVLDRGDEVWIGRRRIGVLLGFDGCHLPNHYNVLIHADPMVTGRDLDLAPETSLVFRQGGSDGTDEPGAGVLDFTVTDRENRLAADIRISADRRFMSSCSLLLPPFGKLWKFLGSAFRDRHARLYLRCRR